VGFVLRILVFGLQAGAIYALVALGIALVYKATGILNFAQGELGTLSGFAAFFVLAGSTHADASHSKVLLAVATLVAVAVGAALGVLVNTLVIRHLASASAVTSLVATAAIALLLTSLEVIAFEPRARSFPRFVDGGFNLPLANVTVSWHSVVILAVLGGVAAALAAFFRTTYGVALLATAQDPFAAELQGVPVARMRTIAWGAAGALGALGGLLGAGVFASLSPGLMTSTFLIPAFTGAVLGGIGSLVGSATGGLVVGVSVAAANQIVRSLQLDLPGPPQIAVLAVLLAVLLLRPGGLLGNRV
jgi:branched-subunit amino acid ABC-type transport system permease component